MSMHIFTGEVVYHRRRSIIKLLKNSLNLYRIFSGKANAAIGIHIGDTVAGDLIMGDKIVVNDERQSLEGAGSKE